MDTSNHADGQFDDAEGDFTGVSEPVNLGLSQPRPAETAALRQALTFNPREGEILIDDDHWSDDDDEEEEEEEEGASSQELEYDDHTRVEDEDWEIAERGTLCKT